MSTPVTYTGDSTFQDEHEPVPGKTEWGMDTLTRTMAGGQPKLVAFVQGLSQGSSYTFNGNVYYLQTWEPDNGQVFPRVTLNYKGLTGGIPTPKASGVMIEQTISITASSVGTYKTATRNIRYVTRKSTTLYIATTRPTLYTYGLDITFTADNIIILESVITATDNDGNNYVFSGANAPANLVTALTPAAVAQGFPECAPVVGSPFFECVDNVALLYEGNTGS